MLHPIFDIITKSYMPPARDLRYAHTVLQAQNLRDACKQALPLLYAHYRSSSEGASTINLIEELLKECE